MTTSKSEWTIDTAMAHLGQRIDALDAKLDASNKLLSAEFKNAADNLIRQAAEYERRLSDLNHEAARINAANALNVSRDIYIADKKTDEEWKHRIEALVNASVSSVAFQAYKESTSTALTLQAGKREGIGITGQTVFTIIIGISAFAGIVLSAIALMTTRPGLMTQVQPPPTIYVTPQTSSGEPPTVKVKP